MNLNGYLSLVPKFSDRALLRFSLASVAAGVALAVAVTAGTGDPIYAGVVAWALSAIASEAGWRSMKVVKRQTRHAFCSFGVTSFLTEHFVLSVVGVRWR